MTAREGGQGERGSRLEDRPSGDELLKLGQNADQTRDIITKSGANAVERIKALEKAYRTEQRPAATPAGSSAASSPPSPASSRPTSASRSPRPTTTAGTTTAARAAPTAPHSNMLGHLAECIAAFTKDLGPRMDKTLLLVMSEFGRTVQENGARAPTTASAGSCSPSATCSRPTPRASASSASTRDARRPQGRPLPARHHRLPHRLLRSPANACSASTRTSRRSSPAYKGNPSNYLNFMKPDRAGVT